MASIYRTHVFIYSPSSQDRDNTHHLSSTDLDIGKQESILAKGSLGCMRLSKAVPGVTHCLYRDNVSGNDTTKDFLLGLLVVLCSLFH